MNIFSVFQAGRTNRGQTMLLDDLGSGERDKREKAIVQAAETRAAFALEALSTIVSNTREESRLRCRAAQAMGEIGDALACDALKTVIHDADTRVVDSSLQALCRLDHGTALQALLDAFSHGQSSIKALAIYAAHLRDAYPRVDAHEQHRILSWCLESVGGTDLARFGAMYTTNVASSLHRQCKSHHDRFAIVSRLLAALTHADAKIRGCACEEVGMILSQNNTVADRERMIDRIIAMLDDRDAGVRRKAVIALCRLIKSPRTIPALEALAKRDDANRAWIRDEIQNI